MTKFILGIDPGRSGAIAVLDVAAHRVTAHDMPDTISGLHDLIVSLPIIAAAYLEKPFYPASIGTANAARIAEAYGALKGALQWRSIPAREVMPKIWKASLGLSTSKAASRDKASMLFPDDAAQWKRVKDDGRAEAALIAWWGAQK